MMRTVASTPARILDIIGEYDESDPDTTRVVQVEQTGRNKGPFKLDLNSRQVQELVKGGEAIFLIQQKVQDGQHART